MFYYTEYLLCTSNNDIVIRTNQVCYVPSCVPYMYFMFVFLKYYFCYSSLFFSFCVCVCVGGGGGGGIYGLNEHLQFQLVSWNDVKIDILMQILPHPNLMDIIIP